ncbi:MAG: hypothetical protein AVDCRST_MAG25-240 [uncultured Rubrobacteraceae bacterium]|uniref:Uncharacterized protein n=1 Tax=uncultured Rubrobacteraceae bacterium TaxID=349277 RepID=A0A6J4QVY1_9ACTN|nr:MAG: hypothetical protein AVDCRST_MAG25-240 [uncultured Rubrobacteraceae bacterium]
MERDQGNGIVGETDERLRARGGHGAEAGAPVPEGASPSPGGWRTRAPVLGAFTVSILLYAATPVAAFPSIPPRRKAAFSGALGVAAEGTFLISALVLGREAGRRHRRYLALRTWFGRSPDG